MGTVATERVDELLEKGRLLSRVEARELLEAVRDRPELLEQGLRGSPERVWTATWLAGVLGEAAVAQTLLCVPSTERDLGWDYLDVLEAVLPRLGPAALPALQARFSTDEGSRITAAQAMIHMVGEFPEVREQVVSFFREALGSDDVSIRAEAICGLMDLDVREAAPEILEAAGRGLNDVVGMADIRRWQLEEKPRTRRPDDLWSFLREEHQAAFDGYRDRLASELSTHRENAEWRRAFEEDLERWREQAVPQPPAMTAGRNDPCPCGSGKKFKRCCLRRVQEEARPDPLRRRLLALRWPAYGYRMLPGAQLSELPRAEVERHLELLSLKPAQARRELARETSDYQLWAGALRMLMAEQYEQFLHFAALVAASDHDHPALDYEEIARIPHVAYDRKRHRSRWEHRFEQALASGDLAMAWDTLMMAGLRREDFVEQGASSLWKARPWTAWTGAALGHLGMLTRPEPVLPFVEEALERVRRGEPGAHPALPEEPCPAWVLEGYLRDLRQRIEDEERLRRLWARYRDEPLCPEDQRALELLELERRLAEQELRDEYHEIARTSEDGGEVRQRRQEARSDYLLEREPLSQRLRELLHRALARSYPDRVIVVAGEVRGRALWLLSVSAAEVPEEAELPLAAPEAPAGAGLWPRFAAALARVVVELGAPPARLQVGSWEGWTAVALEVGGQTADDLRCLFEAVVVDWQPRIAVATTDGLYLVAGGLAWRDAPRVGAAPAPVEVEEEEEEAGTTDSELVARVLRRMLRMSKVGAAHTEIDHFLRGVPDSRKGFMKQCLAALIKDGTIRLKPTAKEAHISLEPDRLGPVKTFLEGGPPPECLALVLGGD